MAADDLTLTIRLYDPTEKSDASKVASWVTVPVSRADITLTPSEFLQKYLVPALPQLKNLKLT